MGLRLFRRNGDDCTTSNTASRYLGHMQPNTWAVRLECIRWWLAIVRVTLGTCKKCACGWQINNSASARWPWFCTPFVQFCLESLLLPLTGWWTDLSLNRSQIPWANEAKNETNDVTRFADIFLAHSHAEGISFVFIIEKMAWISIVFISVRNGLCNLMNLSLGLEFVAHACTCRSWSKWL